METARFNSATTFLKEKYASITLVLSLIINVLCVAAYSVLGVDVDELFLNPLNVVFVLIMFFSGIYYGHLRGNVVIDDYIVCQKKRFFAKYFLFLTNVILALLLSLSTMYYISISIF